MTISFRKIAAVASVAICIAGAASASVLTNGSFETGDFTGWTATSATGSNGALSVTTGGTSPQSSSPIPTASDGTNYAVTDQDGPGAYSLSQSFVAAVGMTARFDLFAQTFASFNDAGSLDHTGAANQHARVDIMKAGAGAFDLGSSIAVTLLAPFSESTPSGFGSYAFNLSSLTAGETYQIRFSQVDNQGFFQMGVDNVSISVSAVPVPASGLLVLSGLGLFGAARRRKAKT